jgi:RNA polymerase sigma factor (sigma-70 family)
VDASVGTFSGLESKPVHPEEIPTPSSLPPGREPSADGRLVEQVRRGDADAGHRFFREYYPGIYRYLLWLTGRPEVAEDLAQETLIRAWRYLDTFDDRAPLRAWLHRIAHREFLRALRSQTRVPAERVMASLEEIAEVAEPRTAELTEAVELHEVIRKLPITEGEIVVLHYLQGYNCQEIARIVGAPVSTVKYRLLTARSHLQRELGEGDLLYLNEPGLIMRQWAWLPLDQIHALEARLSLGGAGRRAPGPADQETPGHGARKEDEMERREFLRQAAVGAAGLMLPETEKEVVDSRLTQKVTCAFKGTALSDLCEHLLADTGVHLVAGPSVADEKVTLFCEKLPLREVMRQLSRPFGYTWLRSRKEGGEYRYELVQDLRSQLLEEELRNRDRNAALLALEKEIERYRPYLSLSPDEALARAQTAPAGEKPLLEKLAGGGWGPIQMYFRLSNQDILALRAGQRLTFSAAPDPGEQPLAPELARQVYQSFRDWRVRPMPRGEAFFPFDPAHPDDPPLSAVPELRASIDLTMAQTEPGEFTLDGHSTLFFPKGFGRMGIGAGPYASGRSRAALEPDNRAANLKLAGEPAFRRRVTLQPQSSCRPAPTALAGDSATPEHKVTIADVLEALHQATGLPVVADYYTRLYKPPAVSVRDLPLFETLNLIADTMRMRWRKEEDWLQFRSASYYDDRLKEVPNRLLTRWSAARRLNGILRPDDLLEIAQLPDAQLDAEEMAEGARDCLGLVEWDLARRKSLRPHLRNLATFTPEQRRMALGVEGLPFTRMTLAQQQQFIALASLSDPLSLQELQTATLRVDYSQPGEFQWGDPGMAFTPFHWVVIVEPGRDGRWLPRPLLRGRTREAVAQAVLRLDPQLRERAVHAMRLRRSAAEPELPVPLEAQIFPTDLSLNVIYLPAASNRLPLHIVGSRGWDTRQTLD